MREGFQIVQIKGDTVVAEFQNVNDAAIQTGLHKSHIYATIRGQRRSTGGFVFKRKETMIEGEIWNEHPVGISVSNFGRVKTQQNRFTWGFKSNRYHSIKWKQKNYYIHRLVLETFVGPAPPECECDHIDRDPSNNRIENLRWVTHFENMKNK